MKTKNQTGLINFKPNLKLNPTITYTVFPLKIEMYILSL